MCVRHFRNSKLTVSARWQQRGQAPTLCRLLKPRVQLSPPLHPDRWNCMATMNQPIIIKRSGGHGGHHGGAWKVAYADFVTAMMALFIVLWLLNSSKQIQVAVGGYFKDPTGTSKKVGNGQNGSGENFVVTKENMDKIKDELAASIRKVNITEKLKDQIEMTITAEGLRIELMENENGVFFPSGATEPNSEAREILALL